MGNWLGNCSDPKVLFEEAVAKSDQIIGFVRYQTFHDSEKKEGMDILTCLLFSKYSFTKEYLFKLVTLFRTVEE